MRVREIDLDVVQGLRFVLLGLEDELLELGVVARNNAKVDEIRSAGFRPNTGKTKSQRSAAK